MEIQGWKRVKDTYNMNNNSEVTKPANSSKTDLNIDLNNESVQDKNEKLEHPCFSRSEPEKTYSLISKTNSAVFSSEIANFSCQNLCKSKTSSILSNSHWIDRDFAPSKKSLFMNGNKIKRVNLTHSNGFKQVKKWLRPFEIRYTPEENLFDVSVFLDPSPKS
jgi:hypothetical protein